MVFEFGFEGVIKRRWMIRKAREVSLFSGKTLTGLCLFDELKQKERKKRVSEAELDTLGYDLHDRIIKRDGADSKIQHPG